MKKKLFGPLLFTVFSMILASCSNEAELLEAEKIQFTFTLNTKNAEGGRTATTNIPESLLLSLEDLAGTPVVTLKEVKLLSVGNDSYIAEPIELKPGSYKITDFLLVTDQSTVLYATPRKGSPLAKAISRPVPFGFSVSRDQLRKVNVEVIDVSQSAPEDFGYVSFNINAVNPLKISIFDTDDAVNMVDASAYIVQGVDTLDSYSLTPRVNSISFGGDVDLPYKLIVTKNGYNDYVQYFDYDDLISDLNGLALKVFMVPSIFTMTAVVNSSTSNSFEFSLAGMPGSVSIDWGDGSNTIQNISTLETAIVHQYSSSGSFPVTVTGDIDKIMSFYSAYGDGVMDEINVQGLVKLSEVNIGLTAGPKVMDFSHNSELYWVNVSGVRQLEDLILPTNHSISQIEISGINQLSSVDVDDIIENVYNNATANNVTSGHFALLENLTVPASSVMVGPPSASSLTKLRDLRDNYSWTIAPDPL